ncbi:MAG: DUF2892 domain-containing protein [Gemmatimonadaceae bacterium]|jgi:hypothetical protein|nr:DUF2892 domain-containing protein [Gemmatimonadaceae bacterium]
MAGIEQVGRTVRAAWYAKNLPTWERWARLLGAAAIAWGAWYVLAQQHQPLLATVLAVSAAVTALTAVVGFCPMCALAGRRLDARAADADRSHGRRSA